MQEFLQLVVSGIATGGIFASLALALVLIYNAMGLVNFAQGEMAMVATFIAFTLISHGVNYWIAFPVTLVIAFAGGIVIQRIVIRPVERAPSADPGHHHARADDTAQRPGRRHLRVRAPLISEPLLGADG